MTATTITRCSFQFPGGTEKHSIQLWNYLFGVDSLYDLPIIPVRPTSSEISDYINFDDGKTRTVLLIEGFKGSPDINPHHDESDDLLAYFDLAYFHDCSTLAIAGVASLAGVGGGGVSKPLGTLRTASR